MCSLRDSFNSSLNDEDAVGMEDNGQLLDVIVFCRSRSLWDEGGLISRFCCVTKVKAECNNVVSTQVVFYSP
jgi:hypothetical protein